MYDPFDLVRTSGMFTNSSGQFTFQFLASSDFSAGNWNATISVLSTGIVANCFVIFSITAAETPRPTGGPTPHTSITPTLAPPSTITSATPKVTPTTVIAPTPVPPQTASISTSPTSAQASTTPTTTFSTPIQSPLAPSSTTSMLSPEPIQTPTPTNTPSPTISQTPVETYPPWSPPTAPQTIKRSLDNVHLTLALGVISCIAVAGIIAALRLRPKNGSRNRNFLGVIITLVFVCASVVAVLSWQGFTGLNNGEQSSYPNVNALSSTTPSPHVSFSDPSNTTVSPSQSEPSTAITVSSPTAQPTHIFTPTPEPIITIPTSSLPSNSQPTSHPTQTPSPSLTLQPCPVPTPRPPFLNVGGIGGYVSIQEAIQSAQNGDTIRVANGTYNENIAITTALSITIQGGWNENFTAQQNNSSLTVINGGRQSSVFSNQLSFGVANVWLQCLTLTNGSSLDGAGVTVNASGDSSNLHLTLENCVVSDNYCRRKGGGISVRSSSGSNLTVSIINSSITNNTSLEEGGGIWLNTNFAQTYLYMTRSNISYNTALSNDAGGLSAYSSDVGSQTTIFLEGNRLQHNSGLGGGAIYLYAWGNQSLMNATLTNNIVSNNNATLFPAMGFQASTNGTTIINLRNNVVAYNNASFNAGAVFVTAGGGDERYPNPATDFSSTSITLRNDIAYGNMAAGQLADVTLFSTSSHNPLNATIAYSIVGVIGNGNANLSMQNCSNSDPQFTNSASEDFHLQTGSQAIDGGDPSPQLNDAQLPPGKGNIRGDIGAYGGPNNGNWLP
ncbi:MAG: hypothetical protein ACBZ72_09890 [Candidatus Bathyarchaeia archaeon]